MAAHQALVDAIEFEGIGIHHDESEVGAMTGHEEGLEALWAILFGWIEGMLELLATFESGGGGEAGPGLSIPAVVEVVAVPTAGGDE